MFIVQPDTTAAALPLRATTDDEIPAGLPVGEVVGLLLRHPWCYVGRRWNYKSAITSSSFRALLFFFTNLSAGPAAALGALNTEFWYRFVTAGGCGALTQAFRRVHPARDGLIGALVLVPAAGHACEIAVHWAVGTPNLLVSIGVSMLFTVLSTSFNLFAMRRGVLTTGQGSGSLLDDCRLLPKIVLLFVASPFLSSKSGTALARVDQPIAACVSPSDVAGLGRS